MPKQNLKKEFRKVIKKCITPNAIYVQPIVKFIKSQKELSYKQGVEEERAKWEKKTIKIPKGKTHPVHDRCEECFQIAKEEVRDMKIDENFSGHWKNGYRKGVKETLDKIEKWAEKHCSVTKNYLNKLKKSIKNDRA